MDTTVTRELMEKVFDALQRAEGYVNAAAWLETANPPHEHGKACQDIMKVRDALAALQSAMRSRDDGQG